MEFQQFVSAVEKRITECIGAELKVSIRTSVKNNGTSRSGITIIEKGINISPTIYLEEYYEQFVKGDRSIETIGDRILELYDEVRFCHSFRGETIRTYEAVRDNIAYKVINREANEAFLKDTPFVPFLDLAIVFYVLIEVNQYGTATMQIKNVHLSDWNVTKEEIYEKACENTPRLLEADFRKMNEVVQELLNMSEQEKAEADEEDSPMYVLSNHIRSFGAACLLYEGMLEKIGRTMKENYFIIPSSVHEVIIVPESESPSKRELEELIAEINETQVEEEEVLSGHAYYYSRKGRRLIV